MVISNAEPQSFRLSNLHEATQSDHSRNGHHHHQKRHKRKNDTITVDSSQEWPRVRQTRHLHHKSTRLRLESRQDRRRLSSANIRYNLRRGGQTWDAVNRAESDSSIEIVDPIIDIDPDAPSNATDGYNYNPIDSSVDSNNIEASNSTTNQDIYTNITAIWVANTTLVNGSFQAPFIDSDDTIIDIANGLIDANNTNEFNVSTLVAMDIVNYYIELSACMQGKCALSEDRFNY